MRAAPVLAILLCLAAGRAAADSTLWTAVEDSTLDAMRGGFDFGNGLTVSFGIERAVYINGALVTSTTLNVGDLARVTPEHAALVNRQAAAMNLVQNGPGNLTTLSSGDLARPGTVIQNTLNNQQIQSQTIINATSNSLGLMKTLNTLTSLREALGNSVR
jgi:Na+-translocating ferredoxin:NAD+ oxidoreductase RnfE subunit